MPATSHLRLWGRANSSNVMKVMWLLAELGLEHERLDVGGPFGGTATPEYRAMNPLGVVPSLQDDGGFTLFESNAILRYLCNAYAPTSSLYPAAARPRAVVDAWLDFQQTALNRPQSVVFQGLVRTAPDKRDMAAIAAATIETAEIWAILDRRVAVQDWVAGADFTLADIAHGVHVHRWFNMPIASRPDAPALRRWYERLLERPAYQRVCAGPVT